MICGSSLKIAEGNASQTTSTSTVVGLQILKPKSITIFSHTCAVGLHVCEMNQYTPALHVVLVQVLVLVLPHHAVSLTWMLSAFLQLKFIWSALLLRDL